MIQNNVQILIGLLILDHNVKKNVENITIAGKVKVTLTHSLKNLLNIF